MKHLFAALLILYYACAGRCHDDDNVTPQLPDHVINEAEKEAKREIDEDKTEIAGQQPLARHHHYNRVVPKWEPLRKRVNLMERTARKLARKLGIPVVDAAKLVQQKHRSRRLAGEWSSGGIENKTCESDERYRSISGICNNFFNKYWGAAFSPFARVANAAYADGMSAPRAAVGGGDLPNARKVSFTVFKEEDRPSTKVSYMSVAFGQFLDHDISHGGQPDINCTGTCGLQGECIGIPIPADDPHFPTKNVTCIEMRRDLPFIEPSGAVSPQREQLNIKSSFIDGSQIYGDKPESFSDVRYPGKEWLLQVQPNPTGGKCLLPPQHGGFCRSPHVQSMPCFLSGDMRTNENPGLLSMHTIFLREHNRISSELKKLNQHWTTDKLYLETRKIVIAELQHITYNEFLPTILDTRTRSRYGLVLRKRGFYKNYNAAVNPSIINAFASAAYRFGHSLVRNIAHRFGAENGTILMNRTWDPTPIYGKGGVDAILRGLSTDASQQADAFFAKAVHEQLVRHTGDLADLAAINIQRGREHGIPGYNTYREICGLRNVRSFSELLSEIPNSHIVNLRNVYEHVDDIDLFVGGMMERPLPGGVLGPTFSCLLGKQFSNLRRGDRFWYEHHNSRTGFTRTQLQSLRKTSLARLICDNGDNIQRVQPRVLAVRGEGNELVGCASLPRISLRLWRDCPFTGHRKRCKDFGDKTTT